MKYMGSVFTLAAFSLVLSATPAFAAPGEASAVIAHCGTPASDYQSTSPVTGQPERNLTYGNTILHFEPASGDWSYLSAWRGHVPVSQAQVAAALPCFRDALADAAGTAAAVGDPTLVADHTAPVAGVRFNRAFLVLLFVLAAVLFISIALPSTRRRTRTLLPLKARPFRRPNVAGFRFRSRKPAPDPNTI